MKTALFLAAIFISGGVFSQPNLTSKPASSIQPTLNLVVQEYFKNFRDVLGDTLHHSEGNSTFESKIKLPGAISCVIQKYDVPQTYSWEAVMFESEDFETAAKKYSDYFKQLNNSKFTPNGFEKFILTGTYDAPDEVRAFASTIMKLNAPRKEWDHFSIDLSMQYQFPDWVIKISMYDKMPDEDMRPGQRTLR